MKKNTIKKRIAVLGLCTVLGIASVGAIASLADDATTTTESGQPPMNNGMYMGKITAIESGSITIETMGQGGGMGMGKPGESMSADGTLPTNASGETETPPALPTDASGETLSAGGMGAGGMGGATTMTFTVDSTLTSSFSVGDMVEITSADGATATAVTAAQQPADMSTTASTTA